MTNIVIHIGSEKTGSTYIQTLLARNSVQLSAQGLFYPSFLGGINHPWLIPLFSSTYYEDVYVPLGLSGLDSVSFSLLKRLMLRKLASWLRTRKDGVFLFSCEYLFSRLNSCEIHGLYEFLANFSSEPPTVIAYLRNPVDLALSLYSLCYVACRPLSIFH